MALVFMLALSIDPSTPGKGGFGIYVVLSAYLVGAAVMIMIAWRSWWWEFRLAPWVHAIDTFAFVLAVYFSEAGKADFNSPFMALTAFLLISATLRWGWFAVAWTSVTLVTVNVIIGAGLFAFGLPIDPYRYGRRLMYLGVLSLMMVWLSGEQRGPRSAPMPRTPGTPGERRNAILVDTLTFARVALQARGAAIAVPHGEEPWTELLRDSGYAVIVDRLGPEALDGSFGEPDRAALIDLARGRRITSRASSYPLALSGPINAPLAEHCGINEAMIVTFETAAGPGQLLIWGIPDMCVDDLPLVETIGRHLSTELDREDLAELAQAASAAALRDALARDLHDSVAQFLAGTLFRLEALSRWIREGHDPTAEINDLKTALRREQGELRAMIQRLRRGEEGDRRTDLVEEMETLLGEMSQHWHIAVRLDAQVRPMPVSIGLAHELRQVLREAVANAARHGCCREVVVSVSTGGPGLTLRIADDGEGFPADSPPPRPRSISERVEALGGTLSICHNHPGALLEIALPNRIA
ncbi:two-component sensor histidine kinase [Novosphingobium sediminis]|uniref:Two-component sensor histidine kinase n=2 Tax=Novosphingobium sediminis TaxID=707214 RepID=A0A512AH31_9SPHN|nr:two-component sensor histidine kinase [Novosphingobium sediminis]